MPQNVDRAECRAAMESPVTVVRAGPQHQDLNLRNKYVIKFNGGASHVEKQARQPKTAIDVHK
jgi:hypothetical protein